MDIANIVFSLIGLNKNGLSFDFWASTMWFHKILDY